MGCGAGKEGGGANVAVPDKKVEAEVQDEEELNASPVAEVEADTTTVDEPGAEPGAEAEAEAEAETTLAPAAGLAETENDVEDPGLFVDRNTTPSGIEIKLSVSWDEPGSNVPLSTPRGPCALPATFFSDTRPLGVGVNARSGATTPVNIDSPEAEGAGAEGAGAEGEQSQTDAWFRGPTPPPTGDKTSAAIGQLGGVVAVVAAMNAHPKMEGVAEQGCMAMCHLALDNVDNRVAIEKEGGVIAVVTALKVHPNSMGVQQNGCGAIANMAGGRKAHISCGGIFNPVPDAISNAGGIDPVLEAMKTHVHNPSVVTWACSAIACLAFNNENNQTLIFKKEGLSLIGQVMQTHITDANVQMHACSALRNMAADNALIHAAAGQYIDRVVKAMLAFPRDVLLAEESCGTIWNLCALPENQQIAASCGAVACVVRAINTHSESPVVQDEGCGAILAMATKNLGNQAAVADEGGLLAVLNALRAHPDNAQVQQSGCAALAALMEEAALNQSQFVELRGVPVVVTAMTNHPDIESIQEHGCTALVNASSTEAAQVQLVSQGALEVVMAALQKHSTSLPVTSRAMATIWHLAIASENRQKIAELGMLSIVMEMMTTHTGSTVIAEHGASVLRNISVDLAGQALVTDQGGIETVVGTIKAHTSSTGVQQQCLGAARAMAYNNTPSCTRLFEQDGGVTFLGQLKEIMDMHTECAGVQERGLAFLWSLMEAGGNGIQEEIIAEGSHLVAATLKAMEQHAGVPEVQTHGCIALSSLSQFSPDDEVDARFRREIGEKGGVTQVLKAMQQHIEVRRMLSASLAALSALTLSDEENRALAAGLDAIPSVLAAMRSHQDSAVVQMHACTALANLMDQSRCFKGGPSDKTVVAELDGLEAIIEAMVAHPAEADMQEAACAAIEQLVVGNRENQLLVSAEDGVHWVVTAMQKHTDAAGVQALGCSSLSALVDNCPANKKVVAATGGIKVVLQAIEYHPDNVTVVQEACTAIWALADRSLTNQTSFAQEGCVELLLQALRDHVAVEPIQREGFRALMALIAGHTQNAQLAQEAGVVKSVIAGMQEHAASPAVQQFCCSALANLAEYPPAKNEIVEEGGIPLVLQAMSDHTTSGGLAESACVALASLSSVNGMTPSKWSASRKAILMANNMRRSSKAGLEADARATTPIGSTPETKMIRSKTKDASSPPSTGGSRGPPSTGGSKT